MMMSTRQTIPIARLVKALCALTLCTHPVQAAPASTNEPGPRLTIDLRDGSRVIGKSLEDILGFHSGTVGDMKLPWTGIRSIQYAGTNAGTARLTATNGDAITIQITTPSLHIETCFGKADLPVSVIQSVKVSKAGRPGKGTSGLPSGVVGLWPGDGDGDDSVGGDNALLTDISFEPGQLGQAFSFNGTSSVIRIPSAAALNVGEGPGLTLTAWIKPSEINREYPIFEWNNGTGSYGVHFHIDQGPGVLHANVVDNHGQAREFNSPAGTVAANVFQLVALTYDKTSGATVIYCNGAAVAQQNLGSFTPQTSYDLYLGRRPPTRGEDTRFAGLMEEVTVYKRALSAEEIKTICTEQNNAQPLPPPETPPRNHTGPTVIDSGRVIRQ
jgi:hypothetical protein